MSQLGEDEVFLDAESVDGGASPELRRSSRTSARKRASTGGVPNARPSKSKRDMSVSRTPTGQRQKGDQQRQAAPSDQDGQAGNPFLTLGSLGSGSVHPADFMSQMKNMMGGASWGDGG